MKIAIKKIDIYKINMNEIEMKFSTQKDGELCYETEIAHQLDEIILEFNVKHEVDFLDYLKNRFVTGHLLK